MADALLKVLIVEDSEDDALLLNRELRRGGYRVAAKRVDTADAFSQALAENDWDLIIADYNMPRFSGLAALQELQRQGKDIPFLVVSGFIDEDVAVTAMKNGAHDYLMKDNLNRLTPAVERELREAKNRREQKRSNETLRAAEARMRQANDSLLYLARNASVQQGNLATAFGEITRIAGLCLGVDRAGIWLFDPERTLLVSQNTYVMRQDTYQQERALAVAQFPRYFSALQDHRYISTREARLDPRTKELCVEYLAPNQIVSSVEATIRLHGEVVGVFRLEACQTPRQWMPEEEIFAGSIADIISLALGADERRQAEVALRQSEQRYRDLIDNATDMIYTMNFDNVITSVNRRGEEMTGYSYAELVSSGQRVNLLTPESTKTSELALQRKLRRETDNTVYEVEFIRKDGHRLPVEINSRLLYENDQPVGIIGTVRDISERKALEDQLRHAQKMEAIGQLAGSVAHDFNNVLTAILSYSQLLLAQIEKDSPWRKEITEIERAGRRAVALTNQLLAFSRKQDFKPQIVNLNSVVADMERMLRRLIGEHVEIIVNLEPNLAPVLADPGRMEQVIMNLAVNSRDAMPKGGKLSLRTANVVLDESYVSRHPEIKAGSYVQLAVSDTGIGIDLAIQQRIFEPFFTTKEIGKGTGLGLSTVYGIIKQNGGHIDLQSEPGKGTTFYLYLPQSEEESAQEEKSVAIHHRQGRETILVVEDDAQVLGLTRHLLEMSGYNVMEARDALEALAVYRNHTDLIAAVISDVVMPQSSGPDLIKRLLMIRPDLRVIFMTGYGDHPIDLKLPMQQPPVILAKPFTPSTLAAALRAALDGSAS